MYPSGAATGISPVPSSGGFTAVQTGIILNTDDIDAAHTVLKAGRADVDDEVARVGPAAAVQSARSASLALFHRCFTCGAPDGYALLVVQLN